MSATTDAFEALVRRRMAMEKASALYREAEVALMQAVAMEGDHRGHALSIAQAGKAKRFMAAGDHIVRTELVEG